MASDMTAKPEQRERTTAQTRTNSENSRLPVAATEPIASRVLAHANAHAAGTDMMFRFDSFSFPGPEPLSGHNQE